jgi:ELWxxDGT repeat protein
MKNSRSATTNSSSELGRCPKPRGSRQGRGRKARRQAPCLPRLEPLEDRFLPSSVPYLLKDINPGAGSSFPSNFTEVNHTAFFSAYDGTHFMTLWASNGTHAGTVLVGDLTPGKTPYYPTYLTNVNGTLFFSAEEGTHGRELWASNGTAAGTFLVSDINPGSSGSYPQGLTNVNGTLFFEASDGTHGYELWESNGSATGTSLVSDINPGSNSSYPQDLTNVNGTLFFSADDGTHGRELWESNGTAAGTSLVQDLNPGSTSSSPSYLTNVNGTLFFQGNDGTHGGQLWRSNGTAAGTQMVTDYSFGPDPAFLTNVNGSVFFTAFGPFADEFQLYGSDGTTGGTVLLTDIEGGFPYFARLSGLTNVNGTLFFERDLQKNQLWRTDGTSAGTQAVANVSQAASYTNVGGTLFFSAFDSANGHQLWKSDGTTLGTQIIADINPSTNGSAPSYLTNIDGALLFAANDGVTGTEPWVLPVSAATSTALASSPSASAYGQAVTLTATVQSAFGAPPPTGTVAFKQGNTFLSVALLDGNGQATYSTAGLAVGQDTITAVYSGSRTSDASQGDDSTAPQVVMRASTTTALASSPGVSAFGQAITFTATVSGVAPGTGNAQRQGGL